MDTAPAPMLYMLMLLDAPDVPFWPEEEALHTKLHRQIMSSAPQDHPEARGLYYPSSCGPSVRMHLVRFHHAWVANMPFARELLCTPPEPLFLFVCHYIQWLVATETTAVRMTAFADMVREVDHMAWMSLIRDARFRHYYGAGYVRDFVQDRRRIATTDRETLHALLNILVTASNTQTLQTKETLRIVLESGYSIVHEVVLAAFPRVLQSFEADWTGIYNHGLPTPTTAILRQCPLLRRRRHWARVRAVYYGMIMMSLFTRWVHHPDRLANKLSGLSLTTAATRALMKDDPNMETLRDLPAEFRILHVEAFFRALM